LHYAGGHAVPFEVRRLAKFLCYNPLLASNPLLFMSFKVPAVNRTLALCAVLVAACLVLFSCGSYNPTVNQTFTTGPVKLRAFVSNPLMPAGTSSTPVLNVVDALNDKLSTSTVSLLTTTPFPGLMELFPNKRFTLVFSSTSGGNSITIVDNAQESAAQGSGGQATAINLPGPTESMVVAPDNVTGFVAVPSVPVTGSAQGAIEVLDLTNNVISATLPVSGARFVVSSHNGDRVLAFGNRAQTVAMITPGLIGTTDPNALRDISSTAFDHPVWAVFSGDDNTAYVLNCGPECGGTQASITPLDVNSSVPGTPIPLSNGTITGGATIGLLNGTTLYVAGSPPGLACDSGTQALTCGTLTVVDLGSSVVSNISKIADGYHNRVELGANGQLFIGARACTNINIPASSGNAGEVRGCLSIFDTTNSNVHVAAVNGDVTGLQPIPKRNVVYVVQAGELEIYDTTTDELQSRQVDILGQAIDVKVVD
jgi:hypothetical protein